ncbi:MAG: hypothetical protein HKN03_12010 [Acidimicrobiales bacterium]|nr:hypothetical protein [Acidimicrobiales bacterium]
MKSILCRAIASSVVATGVMAAPAIASAEDGPIAGCGKGWQLLTVSEANASIDWRIYTTDERAAVEIVVAGQDQNLDNHLCVKQYKPNQGQDKHWGAPDYIITAAMDNVARGQIR